MGELWSDFGRVGGGLIVMGFDCGWVVDMIRLRIRGIVGFEKSECGDGIKRFFYTDGG